MTEDEAKTKICHKTLGATVIAGEANFYPAACIASECMAWLKTDNECVNPAQPPGSLETPVYKPAGYCGLVIKQ